MEETSTKLHSIYSRRNGRLDYDDLNYRRKVITIDDNIELENLAEPEYQAVLSPEEEKKRATLWKDIEFVCNGKNNAKYIIMYMYFYLNESLRNIAAQFDVTHTAIDKHRIFVINALRYLWGLGTTRTPYRKRKGKKLS